MPGSFRARVIGKFFERRNAVIYTERLHKEAINTAGRLSPFY